MRGKIQAAAVLVCFSALIGPLQAQQRVDARNMYERAACVEPGLIGAGTLSDPKRPMYAPAPAARSLTPSLPLSPAAVSASRTGILGFTHVIGDDGQVLVEYVARDRSAFKDLLANPLLKCFVKGVHTRQDVETEFKKHKQGFDITTFGVRTP